MSDQQIRLVLDITAVLAYARGSDDVGETITQSGRTATHSPQAC